ncbi:hypothetical protein [Roseomonas sp. HF4]|uniref:hypothetical protein n=1 Tax=Roseomonas sp. HF4 TaxID=2562313 RepID=UPI001485A387|nr:hypothetical protein [Roseomonas sp. HF4]
MTADLALSIRGLAEPTRTVPRATPPVRDEGEAIPPPAPMTPNPRLRLDGTLGMVVIEFRDSVGDVANTIPSPRQIAAYRAAVVADAPAPAGLRLDGSSAVERQAPPELPEPQRPLPGREAGSNQA